MVQLVRNTVKYDLLTVDGFQFHYGSISSFKNNNMSTTIRKFQFHYGSISSFILVTHFFIKRISIPLWFN